MRTTWMMAALGLMAFTACNKEGGLEGQGYAEPAKVQQNQADLTGKIARATSSEIQLENHPQVLKVDSSTQVTLDGHTVRADQLPAKAEAKVSYRTESGEARATRIEAKSM